jgi:hypothetical protein
MRFGIKKKTRRSKKTILERWGRESMKYIK